MVSKNKMQNRDNIASLAHLASRQEKKKSSEMVSSEENQPADDDIRDLQNKRKFSTFGINPNFEPFSDSYGSIFSQILMFRHKKPVEDYISVNTHMGHMISAI